MGRSLIPLALALAAVFALLARGSAAAPPRPSGNLVEVVVTLPRPSLAVEIAHDRTLAAAAHRSHSIVVHSPAAVSYLRTLAATQRTLAARLAVSIPAARVHWHYGVALDGVSVVLPASDLARLRALPGATVWPTVTYHALRDVPASSASAPADPGPSLIRATALWGKNLATAGQGIKIGVIDDGIDQTHPYFDPSRFSYPAGFPKGNTAYTTPKVIVARAFPSPSTHWKYADRPFDPIYSFHGTHVAGIAAGDYDTPTAPHDGSPISGVAPKAYLGNYKALTVPTEDYGLDGNSPELAKAIDQAVADGMNVINFSITEPEVEPRRDIVVQALDNAAAAGVVPVVAAGNDYDSGGLGTIGSPGNAPAVITAAASTMGHGDGTRPDHIADFSAAGPTPVSHRLKPDVTAPGVDVLSAVPAPLDWETLDGTSMAAPHVAGGAALLLQRHPSWTVEQVKSALASTGDEVHPTGRSGEASVLREGGGRIDLVRADQPLIFTDPTSLGWGLVRRGFSGIKKLSTADAGGGSAPWSVSIHPQSLPHGAKLEPQTKTLVAGDSLALHLTVSRTARAGDGTGFVVLTRGDDVRRVAFWFHVEVPRLGLDPHRTLRKPGFYHGDTAGKASNVSSYRYPQGGLAGVPTRLGGPEQVFRFTLRRRVANFGVAVVGHAPGIRISPRLVAGDDENRVVGYTGMPAAIDPYQGFYRPEPVVGAILPDPGTYEFVFDTPTGAKPGAFTFRFWVNDTSPPSIRLLDHRVKVGRAIRVAVHDSGSGVDPHSLHARVGGKGVRLTFAHGVLLLRTKGLRTGRQTVVVTASDYQETKNMEDVGPVLPNTCVLHATVTLHH